MMGNPGPMAGLKCCVLTSAQSCGGVEQQEFKFNAQTLYLPAAFGSTLIKSISLRCWAYTLALQREGQYPHYSPALRGLWLQSA